MSTAPKVSSEVEDRQLLLSGDNEDVRVALAVDPWVEPEDVDELVKELRDFYPDREIDAETDAVLLVWEDFRDLEGNGDQVLERALEAALGVGVGRDEIGVLEALLGARNSRPRSDLSRRRRERPGGSAMSGNETSGSCRSGGWPMNCSVFAYSGNKSSHSDWIINHQQKQLVSVGSDGGRQ